MDNAGWHAHRRAQKESEYYAAHGGQYGAIEQIGPIEESFIGGFHDHRPPPSPRPPPVPPKEGFPVHYGFPPPTGEYPPPSDGFPSHHNAGYPNIPVPHENTPTFPLQPPTSQPIYPPAQPTLTPETLAHLNAVERSQVLQVARMDPHLQFMCGPLLKYDTTDSHGLWHGAALIVTADSGSVYDPHPKLTYEWDPHRPPPSTLYAQSNGTNGPHSVSPQTSTSSSGNGNGYPSRGKSFDLGWHPADPHSTALPVSLISPSVSASTTTGTLGSNANSEDAYGQEIWVYPGAGGTFTFWRFLIKVPLCDHEMEITYRINNGQILNFYVPGRNQNMRWAAHSCNGFSAGINPDDFKGPGFKTGYDPLWVDLLSKHAEIPFHALVGGGDQLYCDSLIREPEMQGWVSKMKPEERKQHPLTEEIRACIDRFLFNHYCHCFRRGAFARANSSIPMINMCDLIDGFGSYPDDMQQAPVFQQIGARGYFFFLLFQCFINPDIDGLNDAPGKHVYQSLILGRMGPYVRVPSHSFIVNMGPHTALLLLDCRAERRKEQICSQFQYDKVFQRIRALPPNIEHLVIQTGVPVAYPRMVFLETALESKLNPFVALGRSGTLGLSGFVNKFNADAELLDDLNDHWTARSHKKERNWLIEQLQGIARTQRLRISFISGDVHCAAVGVLKTFTGKKGAEVTPGVDHRFMINVVTSAIVNTPPPGGVLTMVNQLSSKVHKTLHHAQTDETMLPLFATDTDGSQRKQKYVMGRRNWCSVDWEPGNGNLLFTLRVEKEKGIGITAPYPTSTPPPGWARG
ncbi:hypothetical protein P691DRAFT_795246 [Macrolepiota fuliginosa MF-IS2]|uniref:PhoD-like phosphatase domain-containing protein n=1 Tax=Macrolepiota fuliginosa MF-IS2 TaxID=1400762 RepID=A0A9P5XIZ4_9AGAR|nr:hypothetical protein P691DRAFT_795246 [Macrolepiota fuliginosa MF-IS2]